jgi:ATP-dependent RNA helicase DDX27
MFLATLQAQRLDSLQRFKDSGAEFLICSDLAGRGLDIPGVKSVINLCMPNTVKQYIHRVGRTARAGQKGRSATLVGEGERRLMRELHKTNAASMRNRVVKPEIIDKFKVRDEEVYIGILGGPCVWWSFPSSSSHYPHPFFLAPSFCAQGVH